MSTYIDIDLILSTKQRQKRAHEIMPKFDTHQQLFIKLPFWVFSLITETEELFYTIDESQLSKPQNGANLN